jgi:hypothetical protein
VFESGCGGNGGDLGVAQREAGCVEISVEDDGLFEARWVQWRLGTRSRRDVERQRSVARVSWIHSRRNLYQIWDAGRFPGEGVLR